MKNIIFGENFNFDCYTIVMKKLFQIFFVSFYLNFIWENAHAFLYASYQNGAITEFILFRAALGDAMILTLLALPFIYSAYFKNKKWLVIPAGIFIAVVIELFALRTGRWEYNAFMPLIPIIHVGLTPTLQLGLLGYLTYVLLI